MNSDPPSRQSLVAQALTLLILVSGTALGIFYLYSALLIPKAFPSSDAGRRVGYLFGVLFSSGMLGGLVTGLTQRRGIFVFPASSRSRIDFGSIGEMVIGGIMAVASFAFLRNFFVPQAGDDINAASMFPFVSLGIISGLAGVPLADRLRGVVLRRVDELDKGVKQVEARTYYAMGLQFTAHSKFEDAEDFLKRVPDGDPLYLTAQAALAEVYARQGLKEKDDAAKQTKFTAAVDTINAVIHRTDELGYRMQRAVIKCLIGNPGAEADLESVVHANPDYVKYIRDRAHDEFKSISNTQWFHSLIGSPNEEKL